MFNLLYSEIVKLKRCYMLLIIISCGIFIPVIDFIHYLTFPQKINLESYVSLGEFATFALVIIMITTFLSSYVFLREYTDNVIRVLYSYPINKISIFISKLIIIFMIITLIYVLHFIALFGGGLLLYKGGLLIENVNINKEFFFIHLRMHLFSMILLFSIVPLLIFITNLFKNLIVTVVIGVLGIVTNLLTVETEWCIYSPFMMPGIPYLALSNSINIANMVVLALVFLIVGVMLCTYQFLKLEEL